MNDYKKGVFLIDVLYGGKLYWNDLINNNVLDLDEETLEILKDNIDNKKYDCLKFILKEALYQEILTYLFERVDANKYYKLIFEVSDVIVDENDEPIL